MSQPRSAIGETYFGADRLRRLAELERWHFWFAGRREIVMRLIQQHANPEPQQVIDLGCGTGEMLDALHRLGYHPIGIDLRPEGLVAARQGASGLDLVQSDIQRLPLKKESADGILLLDVLEHLDDRLALADAERVLVPGGWLVICVPAMPWLWSYRDQAAGHRRRYTSKQLTALVGEAKLEINWIGYYQFLLFPLVVLARLFGRGGPALRDREEEPIGMLNSIFTWLNRVEALASKYIRFPWGSSLVVFCKKLGD